MADTGVCCGNEASWCLDNVCACDNKKEEDLKRMNQVKSLSSETSSDITEEVSLIDSSSPHHIGCNSSSGTHETSIHDLATPELVYEKPAIHGLPRAQPDYEKSLEYFQWVDSNPKRPPSYKAANPNRRIMFPIYETNDPNILPSYSPAVDNLTVISMKQEWLNPYEPSSSRAWKNFIMEINSTQLNFYYIHESLTKGIKNYYGGPTNFPDEFKLERSSRFLPSLSSKSTYQFNRSDQQWLTKRIKNNKEKYLSNDLIFKSFTLQYARYGIPTDYTKKTFVLRLRCELQQFLINFAHVDDMIDWSVYLSIGIDVSLDLAFRELPNYRTVPRRRRRGTRRRRRNRKTKSDSMGLPRMLFVGTSHSSKLEHSSTGRRHSNLETSSTSSSSSSLHLISDSAKRPTLGMSQSSGLLVESSKRPFLEKNRKTISTSNLNLQSQNKTSRRGSDSSLKGIKSRLVTMFHNDKKVVNQHRRTSSSSTLNCVIEDEDESNEGNEWKIKGHTKNEKTIDASPASKDSAMQSPKVSDCICKSLGIPTGKNSIEKELNSINDSVDNNITELLSFVSIAEEEVSIDNELSSQTGFQNAISSRLELDELQNILNEHNDEDDLEQEDAEDEEYERVFNEVNEDEDERDEEEADEESQSDIIRNQLSSATSSIYHEEGIFHDSDDDYIYVPTGNRRHRTSSVTSHISNTPYGSDEIKWNPPRKEISRRRYIRDSLRCIRPLTFDDPWLSKIALSPSMGPKFATNNPPISGFVENVQHKQKNRFSMKKMSNGEPTLMLSKCKNHYLTPYIISPNGLLKTFTKD